MGILETQPEDDGRVATPSVDTTPAAQPPSPRPSITGAETAHPQNEPYLDGFLFSVEWLAFTVPSSTVEEVQQRVGGEWMELKKGFNGYPRAWLNVSTGGGSGRMGTGIPIEHERSTSPSPVRLSRHGSRKRYKPSAVGSMN